MPDFEALIRHQQLKQPGNDQRLKVVESLTPTKNTESKISELNSSKPKLLYYFFAGFSGSLIGTLSLLFLYENKFFSLDIVSISELTSKLFK